MGRVKRDVGVNFNLQAFAGQVSVIGSLYRDFFFLLPFFSPPLPL